MRDFIYLDNAATTRPCEAATEAAKRAMTEEWGNPSSVYSAGGEARRALERDREIVRSAFGAGAKDGRVIFTASGTEANNTAILGTVTAKSRNRGGRVLTTDSEHPSVARAMERLEQLGYEVLCVPTAGGVIDEAALSELANERVIFASFMTANNETGALYDVAAAVRTVRAASPKAIVHTDAVQAFLKTDISPKKTGVDMICVSAHKVNAPKGTGALWVRESVIRSKDLAPYILGGGQEGGMRSGTENTAGIAAFAAAVAEGIALADVRREELESLRAYALDEISRRVPEVRVNRPARAIAGVISLTLPGIRSETALNFLNSRGIFVSAGSACSARSGKASSVLRAFGLTEREADCTVRVSLGHENRREDIDRFAAALADGVASLQRMKK